MTLLCFCVISCYVLHFIFQAQECIVPKMEFIEEITPTGGNATILANSTVAHDQKVRHKG